MFINLLYLLNVIYLSPDVKCTDNELDVVNVGALGNADFKML